MCLSQYTVVVRGENHTVCSLSLLQCSASSSLLFTISQLIVKIQKVTVMMMILNADNIHYRKVSNMTNMNSKVEYLIFTAGEIMKNQRKCSMDFIHTECN